MGFLRELFQHFTTLNDALIDKLIPGFPKHPLLSQECTQSKARLPWLIGENRRYLSNGTGAGFLDKPTYDDDIKYLYQQWQNVSQILSVCFLDYEKELDGLSTWLTSVSSSAEWSLTDQFDIFEISLLTKQLEDNVTDFQAHYQKYLKGELTKIALANITLDQYHLGGLSSSVKSMVDLLQSTVIDTLKSKIAYKQQMIISSYIEMLKKLASIRRYLSSRDKVLTNVLRSRKM